MNLRSKTGSQILIVAAIIGVLGDLLLRQVPWGLNVFAFNAAFVVGAVILMRLSRPAMLSASTLSLFGAQLFFAAMYSWRDADELKTADAFAIIAVLSVVVVPQLKTTARLAGAFHYLSAFIWSGLHALFAPFALLFADVEWASVSGDGKRRYLVSVVRGLSIAAPLLLIFGLLFMSADAAYEGMVKRFLNIDPDQLVLHFVLFAVFSWFSAGYLRGMLISDIDQFVSAGGAAAAAVGDTGSEGRSEVSPSMTLPNDLSIIEHINISDPPDRPVAEGDKKGEDRRDNDRKRGKWNWADINNDVMPASFTLGAVETGVILGLINLLFLSFVIFQIPYLFGGMEFIQNTPDLKLADYARRGFGELVTVSALVLPVLLMGHWLIRKQEPLAGKLFKVLGGIQIALLFVIMASAVQRLLLLAGNLGYGMTTVRLYPLIFMIWLAVVFVWFAFTVMRGARQYFAWGALWSAFLVLGATHVLNPDRFIVQTNLQLMHQGREFDADYNSSLSTDALPTLVKALPEMTADDQQRVAVELVRKYCWLTEGADIRSLNLSRSVAFGILSSSADFVSEANCQERPPAVRPD